MADITAFPTIQKVLWSGNNIMSLKASEDLKAGQAVGIGASGTSLTVVVMDATTYEHCIGVALVDVDYSEDPLAPICGPGCIVYMANADDTTAIDAGSYVTQNDNAVGGTISAISEDASGATATANEIVGLAIDDIAGGGTGRVLLIPGVYTVPNAS